MNRKKRKKNSSLISNKTSKQILIQNRCKKVNKLIKVPWKKLQAQIKLQKNKKN